MLGRWLSRPLTMNRWINALIYGFVGFGLNNSINSFWVTPNNPEGLVDFPGYAVLFLSAGLATWLGIHENAWLDQINEAEINQ